MTNTASQQHIAQRMSRLAAKHASSGFIKSTHALMSVQSAYLTPQQLRLSKIGVLRRIIYRPL